MEKYIQNIELINQFINGLLSKNEIENFKNRLQSDSDFNAIYNEHIVLFEGIKRNQLKTEIQTARKSYIRAKWLKYIVISSAVIIVLAILYSFLFKTEIPQMVQPTNKIEVVSDSVVSEKPPILEIETTDEVKEVTKTNNLIERKQSIQKETPKAENKPILESKKAEVVLDTIESTEEPLSSELKSFYESVKKAPEIIEINTEKDVTVTCKEGTKLTVPAKSFVDAKTGKLSRGKINLEITEFYELSDMLMANLTTKSDDKILETGGMLYLDANKKGSKLKLKDGKHIQVAFNNIGKEDMQLFYGEQLDEGVNWKVQTNGVDDLIEEDIEVPFVVVEETPIYPGCENGSDQQKKACMSRSIQEFVQKNFNTSVAVGLGLGGRQRINVIFKIDKNGSIIDIRSRGSHPVLDMEAQRVINLLPKMKPGLQRGKTVIVPYSLPIVFQMQGDTNVIFGNSNDPTQATITDSLFVKDTETKIEKKEAGDVSNAELNWYVFRSLRLGWINCDRFVRSGKPMIKLKVKIKNSEGSDVKLVFKDRYSILRGRKNNGVYDFGNVPKGEEIVFIVIKRIQDKFYLAIKNGNTEMISDLNLDFEELTISEIVKKIKSLNLDF